MLEQDIVDFLVSLDALVAILEQVGSERDLAVARTSLETAGLWVRKYQDAQA